MRKLAVAGGLAVLGTLAFAVPAHADEAPTPAVVAPAETYIVDAWKMPSWVDATTPTWGQTLLLSSPVLTTKNLDALTTVLNTDPKYCGLNIQLDEYLNDATTTSLNAGKVLNAPGSPAESFPSPGGWGVTYKLIQTPACVVTPPPVVVTPPVTPAPPVTPVAPQTAPVAPVQPALAFTGVKEEATHAYYGGGSSWAGSLLGIGVLLFGGTAIVRRIRARRNA